MDIEMVLENCLKQFSPIRGKDLKAKLEQRKITLSRAQFYRHAKKLEKDEKLDRKNGVWYYRKARVFTTRGLKIALLHSKELLFTSGDNPRVDHSSPRGMMWRLVHAGTPENMDVLDGYLKQHMHGYPSIYRLLERNSGIKNAPSSIEEKFSQAERRRSKGETPLESKERRALETFEEKMHELMNDVKKGIPLHGHCVRCSNEDIVSRDKAG